jgi:hypothetical protein
VVRSVHQNPRASDVNLIAIEVEELHENLAVVLFWVHVPGLNLGHGLQNMHYQADGGESANTTTKDLVDPTHDQKLLHQSDKRRKGRVLHLPRLECLQCWKSGIVLKRDVNFEARPLVGELHKRHLGSSNEGDGMVLCDAHILDVLNKTSQLVLRLADQTRPAALERLGENHQIHVGCG